MWKKEIKLRLLPEMAAANPPFKNNCRPGYTDNGTVWVHKDVKVIMLQQDTDFDNEKTIWDNILRLDNPVVKVVKEYEMLLEEEGTMMKNASANLLLN